MQYIKESLRKRILETALTEFDEKGFDGASMRAIAEGSGTSLGNLYRYFKNKDDLYQNCLFPVLVECIERMEQNEEIFDVSEQGIAFTAYHIALFVAEHPVEFRMIVRGPAKHYAEFRERFMHSVAGKLKAQAQRSGFSGAKNPGFFDAVAMAFISSLRGIMENGECRDTEAYVLELMRFLFAGFTARLGRLEEAPV